MITVDLPVFGRAGAARRRRLLAVAGAVLALLVATVALTPRPDSRAATGIAWTNAETFVGVLTTPTAMCTVTVVSKWMVITAKHCDTSNSVLKLAVTEVSTPGNVYGVRRVVPHPTLDLQALYLEQATAFTPTRRWGDGAEYTKGAFGAWGFGLDRRNADLAHLEMAVFASVLPQCPSVLDASGGDFCFETTYMESLCSGDSGGPVTQGDRIVAMATTVLRNNPSGPMNCEDVKVAQAINMAKIAGWVHDRNDEATLP
jgi:hypothetical protein